MSVYYIHSPETGLAKIGFARDPLSRFRKMQVDSPTRLILLAVEDGSLALEKVRHAQFAGLRARGEWFRFEDELSDFVGQLTPFVRAPRKPLGGALGAWMRNNGHSVRSASKLFGLTAGGISRTCAGKNMPRHDAVLRIYRLTNGEVTPNALYGIEDHLLASEQAA